MANSSAWNFVDSPWDLLRDCKAAALSPNDMSKRMFCTVATILGITSMYTFPIYGTFGIITNLHICLVFLVQISNRSRQMVCLAFLAMADLLNIVILGWLWMLPAKGIPFATQGTSYFFTFNMGPFLCKLHRFGYSFTSCLSTTAFLLVCLDRCVALYFPFKARKCGVKSAWIACGAVLVFSVFIPLPFYFLQGYVTSPNGVTSCTLVDSSQFWQFYHHFFCNVGIFQSILVIIANIALIVKLKLISINRATLIATNQQNNAFSRQEMEAATLILVLSAFFVICSIPQTIACFLAFLIQHYGGSPSMLRFFWNLSDIVWHLFFLQESTNWLIYVWRMPKFRQKAIPCCTGNTQEMLHLNATKKSELNVTGPDIITEEY